MCVPAIVPARDRAVTVCVLRVCAAPSCLHCVSFLSVPAIVPSLCVCAARVRCACALRVCAARVSRVPQMDVFFSASLPNGVDVLVHSMWKAGFPACKLTVRSTDPAYTAAAWAAVERVLKA